MALRFCANLNFMFTENNPSFIEKYYLARKAGFKGVESGFPANVPLTDLLKVKNETGLEHVLLNISTDGSDDMQFGCAAFPNAKDQFKKNLNITVSTAKALNCKKIHVMAGKCADRPTEQHFETYLENLKYAANIFEKEDLIGLIEPINKYALPGYFLNNYDTAHTYIQIQRTGIMYRIPQIPEKEFDGSITYAMLRGDLGAAWTVGAEKDINSIKDPVAMQRDNERVKRAQLKSTDGNTAEIYDQFYRDHKLLLVLFRVLAVMPVLRSSPGRISFSWKSPATIYAIVFWNFMTIIVFIVGRERVKILHTTELFDDYIYAIIFVIFLVPHFWIPFVGWGVAGEVAKYKTMWGAFQVRYYRVTGTTLEFPRLKMLIVIISIGCLLCAVLFLLTLSVLLEGFPVWHTSAYYHIITMINMNCALWYINSRAIKEASKSLSARFRKDVNKDITAALISQYRFLWLNLSELLQSLGNAYARTYSTYCLFMFVNITIAIYGAFSEIFDHGFQFSFKETGLLVDAIYCSTLLYIFCDCSHKATMEVAQGVQDTLLSLNIRNVDKQAQKEIDLFIMAIEMNPAIVSLKGYANVNHELLTSSVTTVSIYLIVLLQFKISLPRVSPNAI